MSKKNRSQYTLHVVLPTKEQDRNDRALLAMRLMRTSCACASETGYDVVSVVDAVWTAESSSIGTAVLLEIEDDADAMGLLDAAKEQLPFEASIRVLPGDHTMELVRGLLRHDLTR